MNYAEQFGKDLIAATEKSGAPMTEKQSKEFITLALIPEGADLTGLREEVSKMLLFQIIDKRIKIMLPSVEVDLRALLWMVSLADGNPGKAVMLVTVLAYLSSEGKKQIMMDDLVMAFPMKVPTDDILHTLWDSQKCEAHFPVITDNKLDDTKSWGL